MLDFQLQQVPFRFGLSEGIDPRQAPPGTLMTAENVVWKQAGRIGKRFGMVEYSTDIFGGGDLTAAFRLFTRGSELCLIGDTAVGGTANLFAYSAGLAKWKSIGKVPNVGLTSSTILDTVGGVYSCSTGISSGGYRIDAWIAGNTVTGSLYVGVVDSGGASVVAPTKLTVTDPESVRTLVIGTTAIVLAAAGVNIVAWTVNLTTLAVSAATNLRTDATTGALGACVIGTNFVIAYDNNGVVVRLYSYNAALTQQATGSIASEVSGCQAVAIDGASGESLYVAYVTGAAAPAPVRIAMANPSTLVETVAPVTIETGGAGITPSQVGVCRYDATTCIVAYRIRHLVQEYRTTSYQVTNAGVVTASTQRGTFGTSMASQPFMLGNACYMMLSDRPNDSVSLTADRTTFLAEVEVSACTSTYTPHRIVAIVDPLIGGTALSLSPPAVSSSTSVYLSVPFQSSTQPDVARQGVRLVNFTLSTSLPADMWRATSYGAESFLSAGFLASYDGRSCFDYGFVRGPTFYSIVDSNGAGSIALGVYLYATLQEYRSATGMLYRSPTLSANGSVTVDGANDTVTIQVVGYNVSAKQNTTTLFGTTAALPTLMPWYRTIVDGTVYQRLTVEPAYSVSYADLMTEYTEFIDLYADANIGTANIALASRPALYTTGGILDDYQPPGNVTQFMHADRLWVLAHDQKTWWYSKAFNDDLGVAPGFNPEFRISLDETQTAGASMDEKAIFFSASGIRYMLGLGPSPAGLNSDFQSPTRIQSDVGCTTARSVVSMPDGLMFMSARGIYLLTRGLELVWVGRAVKDTLASFPTVTSAVLVAKHNQVRFTCNNTAGDRGVVLVYDYVEKQWSTFRHQVGGAFGLYGTAYADACMWDGEWTFVTPSATVCKESATSYLDGAAVYVPMTLETAWMSATGPLAFHSVRTFELHGESFTNHDVTISVGFDSNTTYQQTATWLAETPVTTVGPEEASVTINTYRKCNTIRFKVVDATPTSGTVSTGRGPAWGMMGLEVGVKRGFGNAPATKRA